MPGEAAIHAVIATQGPRGTLLRRTLESLAQADRPAALAAVWIVENGSDAGAREIARQPCAGLPVRYVHLPQGGKSRALAQAMDAIGDALMLCLDDDIRVAPALFQAYADAAAAHPDGAFFGGPLSIDYEQPPPPWLLDALPASARGWELPPGAARVSQPCFLGANYAFWTRSARQVGGFDAVLGVGAEGNPVGEEEDLQRRLLAAGLAGVYLPEARVWHWVPQARCTPAWALQRLERVWLTDTLRRPLLEDAAFRGPRLAGVPRWMWRRRLALGVRAWLAAFVPDPRRRFEMRRAYYQWRGHMQGVRLRLRREARQE